MRCGWKSEPGSDREPATHAKWFNRLTVVGEKRQLSWDNLTLKIQPRTIPISRQGKCASGGRGSHSSVQTRIKLRSYVVEVEGCAKGQWLWQARPTLFPPFCLLRIGGVSSRANLGELDRAVPCSAERCRAECETGNRLAEPCRRAAPCRFQPIQAKPDRLSPPFCLLWIRGASGRANLGERDCAVPSSAELCRA